MPEVEERLRAVAEMMDFLDLTPESGERPGHSATSAYQSADAGPDGPVPPSGQELRHDRYQVGARLGEGGMGVVYRARDARENRDVALKLMKSSLTGTSRRRFEREFRTISALQHPSCIRVFDYGEVGGEPFFTMELFQGRPITSLAGLGLDEVLRALLRVTLALDYIHHHGIIHRDVKPSNILVRPAAGSDGVAAHDVRLMDFGLAKYYGVKSSLSAEAGFVGTVAYCAPEQINNDELDHRTDLYCLGLVGYELLSGRYPFPEARMAGVRPLMQAQLNDKPRPLSEANPALPGPIADAVMRYLRKQAHRRPESGALLRDAIAAHLGLDLRADDSLAALGPARPRLSVTGFVCRLREQEEIDNLLRRCLRPTAAGPKGAVGEVPPSLILVRGEPGIGKSSVVQEAERIARGHGCQVYEGRCFDGNLSPFQPFVEIIRQLVAELRLQERREAEAPAGEDLTATQVAGLPAESLDRLLAVVNDYSGELLRVAPELGKYLPGEAYRQIDFGREADYIFRALSSFFLEIATLQPVCLSFEDLQWADKSSLDLLRHLAAALSDARRTSADGPAAPPRLVIVGSARTGYPQLESFLPPLRERRQILEMNLDPLGEEEARELIALRLNCRPEELSDDLVARVHLLCGGNPFFVAETVREWFEKDAITRGDSGWILSAEAADASDLPETVRDVMRLRLQGLPEKARQVLNAAAVIGAVVDIDLLREVVPDLSESDVLDAVDALLPRRVFRETANAGRVEFVHDLLREMPYADLSAARRQSLHRRVGERLEARRAGGQAVAPALLADHFRNAEDRPKAFTYTVEAAETALEAYAFNNAIGQLTLAQKLLPDHADRATHCNLWMMMGKACGSSGRLDDAIEAHMQAIMHAEDRIARATAEHGLGENYHRKGQFEDAFRHLDAALEEVGYPRPAGLAGTLFDTWKSSLYFYCFPRWLRLPGGGPDRARRLDIAFASYYLYIQILGTKSVIRYVHATYKAATIAKDTQKSEHNAVAYSKFALNLGAFGMHRLARFYIRASLKAVELRPRDVIWARTVAHVGTTYYFGGLLDEGEAYLSDSLGVLDKTGDYYSLFAHHFLYHIQEVRGDIPRELAEAEVEISLGNVRGDGEALSWGYFDKAYALACAGQTDPASELALRAVEILHSRGSTVESKAQQVLGFVRLQASDHIGARVALEEAARLIRVNLLLMEFVAPTYPMLVESLLGPRWAERQGGPSRAVARKARHESRFARFIGWLYPNYEAHTLRVSGRAAFAMGKTKAAANYLERAIVAAETHGARYELARALLDASRVIPERADEYHRRGEQLLDELGAVVPEAERIAAPQ
ncbi:serine/threonine-protein kinase PknK (plasmid) [Tundrisphaera lichenicola]|uniref:serine/threonine-protein kinase n=1 Tax=Tundrisphaera lichenicola TaxID=2029860 RepID=UPI003EBB2A5D